MAIQEILLSTCDRCTAEERTPLDRKARRSNKLILPKGWLHVSGNTETALVFEMDLCEECKNIVLEIAGKARPTHTTRTPSRGRTGSGKSATESKKKAADKDVEAKPTEENKPEDKSDDKPDENPEGLRLVESA